MSSQYRGLRRIIIAANRRLRELAMIAKGVVSTDHPVMAHIIPMRRCNLSCAYCNEYDTHPNRCRSASCASAWIIWRGWEPRSSPSAAANRFSIRNWMSIIRHIRTNGMIAGLITNGYLLTAERIQRLNRAGLDHMQISIDNVMPDEVSKKSLKVLDKKLQLLAEYAEFHVNINSVVGGGMHNPHDALVVGRRARQLGFTSTVGIIHDGDGPAASAARRRSARCFFKMHDMEREGIIRASTAFRTTSRYGKPNEWRCRAGARYIYICEDGLVHYCSQQRGYPGEALAEYTVADIRREFLTEKSCAPNCTVSCVHQISYIDFWRAPQQPERACPRGIAAAEQVLRNHVPGSPMPQPTHRPSARPTTGLIQINTGPATE